MDENEKEKGEEITRDVRRGFYLASSIYLALDDLRRVLPITEKPVQEAVLGILHHHLEKAWDDGAKREADLRTALATEASFRRRLQVEAQDLKRQLFEALKKISDSR